MSVNFCLPEFSPMIRCCQIAADEHDVYNLISSDPHRRRRGFRAEHFIKPPIEIIVKFPHYIDVSHILLGLRSGPQQVSAVKLFSDCPIGRRKWDYQFIGKCEKIRSPKLCFQNVQYKPRDPFSNLSHSEEPQGPEVLKLPLRSDANVFCIQRLKVRITEVANRGVAVLSLLQVWGQPARGCDSKISEKIFNKVYSSRVRPKMPVEEHDVKLVVNGIQDDEEDNDIPSEFLDSITNEVMAVPMVLPSGNAVDQQTIEKCNKSQEIYGRSGVDPFTGISFSGKNHPRFNAALKARIDEYLVKKGASLTVPRSVGTHENVRRKVYKSSLCTNNAPYLNGTTSACSTSSQVKVRNLVHMETYRSQKKQTFPLVKECKTDHRDSDTVPLETGDTVSLEAGGSVSLEASDTVPLEASDTVPLERVCEEMRKESLKVALQEILGPTRRFTNFSQTVQKPKSVKCVFCDCHFSNSMFQLPCEHIICRTCMVDKLRTSPKCNSCSTAFLSSSVERVFV